MSFTIVLQSLNQLQTLYRNGWQNILNGCACLLYLGGDEEETTKYLSARAGKQTLSIRKHSMNKGNQGGGSENRDKYGRDLIDRSEVALIGGDECLVFISKEHVFKDKKFYAFQHGRADELATGPTDDKWYTWRRYMTDEEAILDKISATDIIDHGEITSELKEETHV